MKKVILFIALVATPVFASDWVRLTETDTGSVVEVDTESRGLSGSIARIWLRIDHSKDATKKARQSKELWKFNCQSGTSFTASWVNYAADGSVISSGSPLEYDFKYEPVVPDTVGDTVMKIACDS